MIQTVKYNYLVKQYKNRIYSYAYYMMHNRMDADDITQEVFIRIWKNMGRFNIAAAKSWIMKTTHNLCLDFIRNRQVSAARNQFIDDDEGEVFADEFIQGPDITAHSVLMQEAVENAVSRLPVNMKSIFIMYEIQGLKYEDISRTLDMPLNSVKVNLMRARKKLQKELRLYRQSEVKQNG